MVNSQSHFSRFIPHVLGILLVLTVALSLRVLFLSENDWEFVEGTDADKYLTSAYNLKFFQAYSFDKQLPPRSRTDLAHGYPIFLSIFMQKDQPVIGVFKKVYFAQAVLGSLIACLVYLVSILILPRPFALIAAMLTAISPHLIAVNGYILTETLFTLFIMSGLLLVMYAWKYSRYSLAFVSGIVLSMSVHIRTVSYLLPVIMPLVFFWSPVSTFISSRKRLGLVAAFLAGVLMVGQGQRWFNENYVENQFELQNNGKKAPVLHRKYTVVKTPEEYLNRAFRPPNFFMEGRSHIFALQPEKTGTHWRSLTTQKFSDAPMKYIHWNTWGKLYYLWNWDNAYNSDVYYYNIVEPGFHNGSVVLEWIHRIMRFLHWPLFVLSLSAIIVFALRWRNEGLSRHLQLVAMPVMVFCYFLGVLWVLSWLPRYTVPVRSVSYILVAFVLTWFLGNLRNLNKS